MSSTLYCHWTINRIKYFNKYKITARTVEQALNLKLSTEGHK